MGRVVRALLQWTKDQNRRRPQNRSSAHAPVVRLPAKVAALISLRAVLDGTAKSKSYHALVHEVGRRLDEECMGRWLAKEHRGAWDSAKRRALVIPERANARLRKDARRIGRDRGYRKWTMGERARAGALLLELVSRVSGMVTLEPVTTAPNRHRLVPRLAPEVADWIARADRHNELLEPFYMPMVDVPGDWGPGRAGGYATDLVRRKSIVKNTGRRRTEAIDSADMPDVYAAVNALQRTAWEVNPDVAQVARALWDSGRQAPGMEKAEDDPYPPMPGEGRTGDWMRRRFLVRRGNLYRSSRRVEAARTLWLAERMLPLGAFHYPQQLDFRGRVYPVPTFPQPQGTDFARGLLRFETGSWIALKTCPEAFWVHGANCAGQDKLPIADRVAWILRRRQAILDVSHDPLDCSWWQEADEPWQFLAWCLEAGELLGTGMAHTRVPCYVDGSNNGLQILSLLLRDEVGGRSTNCRPGERRDVYQDVADAVTRALRERDDTDSRTWLSWFEDGKVPRAAAKRSVMTLPYGCTPWSSRNYVMDWFEEEVRQGRASPWGTDPYRRQVNALADTLWDAIRSTVGRALECMEWLRAASRASVEAGSPPSWLSPTGFPVRQSYTNFEVLGVRTKFGERVRWVQSRVAGERMNARRHVNALPPNFVHSLDAAVLCRTVARLTADKVRGVRSISTIHDSFGVPAGDVAALHGQLRLEYARLFREDLLQNLQEQLASNVGGRYAFPEPPARGTLDPGEVIGSTYLFA